ncbi:MBL fold metallo-hydrolase [Actinoplanes sp. G11-F43]|uniref:MBL fold metallo-hydrolase n=1 Tax=Actinoplanes sp. G11-F43 TaxID=3424130 RepID=UPI003D34C182
MKRRLLLTAGSGVLGVTVLNTMSGCTRTPAKKEEQANPNAVTGDWQRVNLDFVSVYLLVRGGEVAVVDTGTPGSAASVEDGLRAAGLGWSAVKHVILTHQHQDHAGGLAEMVPLTAATLYAGEADVTAIGDPGGGRGLRAVKDGDEVFGLRIIGTPGHTPGHVSIFEPATGVLVTGDALRNQNGLEGSAPQYTADETQAAQSVRKMAALDVRAILPGHGEPLTTGARDALRKLAASL